MWRWLVVLLATIPVSADLRIVTKLGVGSESFTSTEYYKGDLVLAREQ